MRSADDLEHQQDGTGSHRQPTCHGSDPSTCLLSEGKIPLGAVCDSVKHLPAFSRQWREELERGEVELAFGVVSSEDGNLRQRKALDDPWVVVLGAHRAAACEPWNVESFAALRHGMMTVTGRGEGHVDAALRAEGYKRQIAFRSTSPLVVAMLAAETDLAVTTTRLLAKTLVRHLPLVIRPLPVEARPLELPLVWHERVHGDARHRWVRDQVVACVQRLGSTG